MTGYAVIIEGEGNSFSAYVPELPGCIVAGSSVAEIEKLIREAIELHIEGMRARTAADVHWHDHRRSPAVVLNGRGLPENAEWQVQFDVLDA